MGSRDKLINRSLSNIKQTIREERLKKILSKK